MKKTLKYMFCFALLLLPLFSEEMRAQSSAIQLLKTKAESLEVRGRADLAMQAWQQILTTDPNNEAALAGLARNSLRQGRTEEAAGYLARLRRVNSHSPELSSPSAPTSTANPQILDQAARLAAEKQYVQAMALYNQAFAGNPPTAGWALAYYETEANVPGGWDKATAGLREFAARYPSIPDYRLALARLLTYRTGTRPTGRRMLQDLVSNPATEAKAREAWRQSLLWDKTSVAALPSMQEYLKRYSDAELQTAVAALETVEKQQRPVTPGSHDSQLGYAALKAGNLEDAEAHFHAALQLEPKNASATAGVGYVRLKQQDFDSAARFFTEARTEAPHDHTILQALGTATFWQTMQQGAKALANNDAVEAKAQFTSALAIRPASIDAMLGLAGALGRERDYKTAAIWFQKVVAAKPDDLAGWRGLVNARLQTSGRKAALQSLNNMPPGVTERLGSSPDFLAMSAEIYAECGQQERAKRFYNKLLSVTADRVADLPLDTRIQVAGLMVRYGQSGSAISDMLSVIQTNPDSTEAWQVLLGALAQEKRENEAISLLKRMPEPVRTEASQHSAFLLALASVESAAGNIEEAKKALEKAREIGFEQPSEESSADLELANLYVKEGDADRANALLEKLTEAAPENEDGWKSYASVLHVTHRDADVVALGDRMPEDVRQHLRSDPGYLATVAASQSAAGNPEAAAELAGEAIKAASGREAAPLDVELQLAWVLLDVPQSSGDLYSLLEKTGLRSDLNGQQRKELNRIWTTWVLRSAAAAHDAGDSDRALAILRAGCHRFPHESSLQRALAGALMESGESARALSVYKNWGLRDGNSSDYAGAIGAALSANDKTYASLWLRDALAKYGSDSAILNLAGQDAANHGDYKRAKLYWKEALTASQPKENSMKALLVSDKPPAEAPVDGVSDDMHLLLVHSTDSPTSPSSTRTGRLPSRESFLDDSDAPSTGMSNAPDSNTSSPLSKSRPEAAPKAASDFRSDIQDEIDAVDSRNTPYVGTDDSVQSRNGTAGYDKFLIEQADFQASTTVGGLLRVSLDARPTHIESGAGQLDPNGTLRLGTLPAGNAFPAQVAGGTAGDVQISTDFFGAHVGMAPGGFLVKTKTGGIRITPGKSPFTFIVDRDNLRDSFLSYAGTKDPATGQVWGGVVANTAAILGNWGDARSGFYTRVGYQVLTGMNVETNHRIDGNIGRYWQVYVQKDLAITLGLNATGMHYDNNLRYFTLGQGGYFSPQQYVLVNVPVRITGTYNRRLQYLVAASLGAQHFQENDSPYFPLNPALQAQSGGLYAGQSSTGANYDFNAKISYQLTPYWFVGAYADANNARYYSSQSVGFYLKYSFDPRPLSLDKDARSVPDWKGQQPFQTY